jgi:hypothetical protein
MPALSFRDAIEMVVENWFNIHCQKGTPLDELGTLLEWSDDDLNDVGKEILHEPDAKSKAEKTIKVLERINYFGDHDDCLDDLERAELDRRTAQASAENADESAIDTQSQIVDDVVLLQGVGARIQARHPTLKFEIDQACRSIRIWEPNAETEIHLQVSDGKVVDYCDGNETPVSLGTQAKQVVSNMNAWGYFDLVNGEEDIDEGPKPNVCENCGGALDFNYCTFCQTRQQPETD